MTNQINVLMTGAGAPGGPGIIKALQQSERINLIVADADEQASGRFLNKVFEQLPKANNDDFISEIIRLCNKHEVHIVFPLVTNELFQFAKHKDEFLSLGIKVIVSDDHMLQLANNKRKLYEHLSSQGILVPEFYVVNSLEEFKIAASKLGYPNQEFCFKPSVSNGSRGFRIISDSVNEHELLFKMKPNATYMSYDKALAVLSSQAFPELLLTEFLPGEEYTIDTMVKNGAPQIILPRKRLQMREGISIKGEFVNNNEIIQYCRQILQSLYLHGPIGIQVKRAVDGTFKILEINPRIQGTSVAALGLGINLPLMAVSQEVDGELASLPKEIKWGMKFVRYYQEVFFS